MVASPRAILMVALLVTVLCGGCLNGFDPTPSDLEVSRVGGPSHQLVNPDFIEFASITAGVIVRADTPDLGPALWKVDDADLVLVADVCPDVCRGGPYYFAVLNDALFFTAYDSEVGNEVWKTNGSGAELVADLRSGLSGSNPNGLTRLGEFVYFSGQDHAYYPRTEEEANNGWTHDPDLWRTNGETVELVSSINPTGFFLKDFGSEFGAPIKFQGFLYFSADDLQNGRQLWRTNGNNTEPVLKEALDNQEFITSEMTVIDNTMYFVTKTDTLHQQIWATDGVSFSKVGDSEGTSKWAQGGFTKLADKVYFTGVSSDLNNGFRSLWQIDGSQVYEVSNPAMLFDFSSKAGMTNYDSFLYFGGWHRQLGTELWRFDGNQFEFVADINPGDSDSNPMYFTEFHGALYFQADDGIHGTEVWRLKGDSVEQVTDINPKGNSDPRNFEVFGDRLFFSAESQDEIRHLWVIDRKE